ncbi:hypothetical protein J2Y83_003198 [Pseudomonas marginalis]|uniref:DUF7693 family protein n=1 Tax=Pseudomonas marginalis TaxID=298 RepID=UPI00209DCD5F|nr:hypothetical protein [Pseudomonas marginalis]MCP1507225.1 hypothetical protein [Pseudomonas marginalis]MCP1524729.1 hypothetical protein [Pseudomonas marginalis]MDQ0502790.1 hypothetical protein [Pseudomonas marginalis]
MTATAATVSAREAYQVLKDMALETRVISACAATDDTVNVEIDGWQVVLLTHGALLVGCQHCRSPDGRNGSLDSWQRYGTNPVALMSTWEQAQVERLLSVSQRQLHDTPV